MDLGLGASVEAAGSSSLLRFAFKRGRSASRLRSISRRRRVGLRDASSVVLRDATEAVSSWEKAVEGSGLIFDSVEGSSRSEWLLRDEPAMVDEPALPALPPRPRAPFLLDRRLRGLRAFLLFSLMLRSLSSLAARFERKLLSSLFRSINSSISEDGSTSLIGLISREEGLIGDLGEYVKPDVSNFFHLVKEVVVMMEDGLEWRFLDGALNAGILESGY